MGNESCVCQVSCESCHVSPEEGTKVNMDEVSHESWVMSHVSRDACQVSCESCHVAPEEEAKVDMDEVAVVVEKDVSVVSVLQLQQILHHTIPCNTYVGVRFQQIRD